MTQHKDAVIDSVLYAGSPCARLTEPVLEEEPTPKPMILGTAWLLSIILVGFTASAPFLFNEPTAYSIFERLFAGCILLMIFYLVVRALWRGTGQRAAISNAVFAVLVLGSTISLIVVEMKPFHRPSKNEIAVKRATTSVERIGRDLQQSFVELGFMTYDPTAATMIRDALSEAETQMEGIEQRAMRLLKDVVEHYNLTAVEHGRLSEELQSRLNEVPADIDEYLELVRVRELCRKVMKSNEEVMASVRALPKALEERATQDLGRGKQTDEMLRKMRTSTMHLINVHTCEDRIVEAAMKEQDLLAREWGRWIIDKKTRKITFERPEAAEEYATILKLRQSAELMYARAVEALFMARVHPLLTSSELVSAAGGG